MMLLAQRPEDVIANFMFLAIMLFMLYVSLRKWKPAQTAFGHVSFATDKLLRRWHMLGKYGLIIGRTISGELIRIQNYCHCLCVGGSGSGKGVGIVIPNALDYKRGSLFVFDPKDDIRQTTSLHRKAAGKTEIHFAPFNGGTHRLNPLDYIRANDPNLEDFARALMESLVIRTGLENDPYWNSTSVKIGTAILVFILISLSGKERSLNSLQDIASDPKMAWATANKLIEMGGIPARMGYQILSLFEGGTKLTKEGSSVLNNLTQHLSWLDSYAVCEFLSETNFDLKSFLSPYYTFYLRIPPDKLESHKGLFRCILSTIIREVGMYGSENNSELLCLIDEASLCNSLPALEEALVRGRSSGVRLLLIFQSDAQVQAAFKDKPTLIYDNCDTKVYLGANSIEGAERLSRSIGSWTQIVDSYAENWGYTRASDGSIQRSYGGSLSYAQTERAVLRPEEILTLSSTWLFAFQNGFPSPILAKRIRWYADRAFNPNAPKERRRLITGRRIGWTIIAGALVVVAVGLIRRHIIHC